MPDIFISYSRKDSPHALGLAEKLRSNGIEVWIDQQGVEAVTSWSAEIEQAIKECKAFCLLLSRASLESNNVVKETSLATEYKRSIVLIELYVVTLTDDFHSQLAGFQRVSFADFDAILLALKKLGIGLAPPSPVSQPERTGTSVTPELHDSRKSLIVLPFEDLSPSGEDNAWFADGLTGEMIDALGHIKSLRILDRNTSLNLRGVKLRTVEIGKEFNTRYFIEGSVRKFGDQLKISAALLDIETGDYLWQESLRGQLKDIFDIQEAVATKAVVGLKLTLTKEEKTLVQDHGTENADAYELYLKARDYLERHTREGLIYGIQLLEESIQLDPRYAQAYQRKAHALSDLYRNYEHDPKLLRDAEELVKEAIRLNLEPTKTYAALVNIYTADGRLEEAERVAHKFIDEAPMDPMSYFTLGLMYGIAGQDDKAIAPYERAMELDPDSRQDVITLWNFIATCDGANEKEKCRYWAEQAIGPFERHLKLHPDDETRRVDFALLLLLAGRREDALRQARSMTNVRDGNSLFVVAALWIKLGDVSEAFSAIQRSIDAGFREARLLRTFLEDDLVIQSKGTPEYVKVERIVEGLV